MEKVTLKKWNRRIIICLITILLVMMTAGNIWAADDDLFDELGIDIDKKPDGYVNDGSNPYGRDNVTINPVSELLIGGYHFTAGGSDTSYDTSRLYGNNATVNHTHLLQELEKGSIVPSQYDAYLTASGDFTGSGKKGQVVAIGANAVTDGNNVASNNPGLDMFFIDPITMTGSSSGNIFSLYDGTIGQGYELTGGFLKYVNNDNHYNSSLLHNYMQIVTGDFTGDGIDEVAVYIPDPSAPRVEVYQLQYTGTSGNQWQQKSNWKKIFTYALDITANTQKYAPNKISMTTGDLNYDGQDDLIIGYGLEFYGNIGERINVANYPFQSTTIVALFSSKRTQTFEEAVTVADKLPANFGITMGDIDGSGRDKLIYAGISGIGEDESYRKRDNTYEMHVWKYNPDAKKFSQEAYAIDEEQSTVEKALSYVHVRADVLAVRQGPGQPDKLYYRGFLYHLEGNTITKPEDAISIFKQEAGKTDDTSPWTEHGLKGNRVDSDYFVVFEYGAAAVDIDNDSAEEIVFTYSPVEGDKEGPINQPNRGLVLKCSSSTDSGLAVMRLFLSEQSSPSHTDRSHILMATPDVDNDSMTLKFKEHYLAYSDPKVLAVLAGAPVYKDIEHLDQGDGYIGESGTSWATYEGSGTSETSSQQFSLGAYFGYSHDVTIFGAPLFSIDFEADYKHSWTWETEKRSMLTEEVSYETYGYTDGVALYSVPIAVYVYEATIAANADGTKTETQEFFVNIPYSPAVTTLDVDEYDQIAVNYDGTLPQIRKEGILSHIQGRPDTYPSNTAGLKDAITYSGNYSMVGYGSTAQTQTITIDSETSKGLSHSDEFSFKIGGGAGGVKTGLTLGGAFGYGKADITTNGSIFTGSVFSMPEEARGYGYGYSWKIMHYWHEIDSDTKIPVVSYLVDMPGGARPINQPQNLDIDITKSTTSSLTLSWDYDVSSGIDGFKIYRHNLITGQFEELFGGYVPYNAGQGHYEYTDQGLSSGSQYTYKLQAVRSTAPTNSLQSAPVSGWTLATEDASLALSTYDLKAYTDKTYTITSELKSVAGAGTTTYAWEKNKNGRWQEIGLSTSSMHISAPQSSTAGEYRLRATQQLGQAPIIVYSPTLTINVEKRKATVALSLAENNDDLVLTATLQNTASAQSSGAVPDGSVTFELSHQGEESNSYTAPLTGNPANRSATAVYTIPSLEDGYYTIQVIYAGSRIFQAAKSQEIEYIKGSDSVFFTAPSQIYYGETMTPRFWRAEEVNGEVKKTEITAQLSDGYKVTFKGLKKQEISLVSLGIISMYRGYKMVDAKVNTDYTLSGLYINNLTLDAKNFNYAYKTGNRHHYEAEYTVTTPGGDKILKHSYTVNPLPLTVTAKSGEIEQSAITALGASDFDIGSAGGSSQFAFDHTFSTVLKAVATSNSDIEVPWNTNTPLGNYTIKATPLNNITASYYSFITIAGQKTVTDKKYAVTVQALPYSGETVGSAAITSHPNVTNFPPGTGITLQATPYLGYEVDAWAAYVGSETTPAFAQQGGETFKCSLYANTLKVTVSFKPKNTPLTYEANPVDGGDVTAQYSAGGAIASKTIVLEGSPVKLTATPREGYAFALWYVYTNSQGIKEYTGKIDAESSVSTLEFNMPGQALYAEAVFTRDRYPITFSSGLRAYYLDDTDDDASTPDAEVWIKSGDQVPGDKTLTILPTQWQQIQEWLEYPESTDIAVDKQQGTYIVKEAAHFEARAQGYHGLGVIQPNQGTIDVKIDGQPSQEDFSNSVFLPQGSKITLTVTANDNATHVPGYWTVNGHATAFGESVFEMELTSLAWVSHVFLEKKATPTLQYDTTIMSCKDKENLPITSGTQVTPGTELYFDAIIGQGEHVVNWTAGPDNVNQAPIQSGGKTLQMAMPQADTLVKLEKAINTYAVTVINGSFGKYLFDDDANFNPDKVSEGSSVKLQVQPHSNYTAKVEISGGTFDRTEDLGNNTTLYTIDALMADVEITITYQDIRPYTITVQSVTGGSAKASSYQAQAGTLIKLSATASQGYRHNGWQVRQANNDEDITVSKGEFTMPTANVVVTPIFIPSGGNVIIFNPTPEPSEPEEVDPIISFAGFINGFEDNTFRGEEYMTREQFVKILYVLKTAPSNSQSPPLNPSFQDVATDRWSYPAIEWAKQQKIIAADANGNFRPDDILKRSEMAAMLAACENFTETAEDTFTDLADHPQRKEILQTVAAGIFTGYPDGSFRPDEGSKRSEVVTALVRYLLGEEPTIKMMAGLHIPFSDVQQTYWAYPYILLAVNGYSNAPK